MIKSILFLILTVSVFASPPSWYINNTILSKDYEIIGYGSGATKQEANQIAKSDIANSMQTTIKSNLKITKSTNNGNYNKNIETNINQSTTVNLNNLEIVKSSFNDGKYYIALKYINLPFAKQVRLKFEDITNIKKETNSYLLNTILLKELKSEFGFYPKIKIYNNNIIIGNQSFNITKNILQKLFASTFNTDIILNIPKQLKHNDFYFIDIKSNKSGYMTLIQIYENGETSILFSNKKVKNNTQLTYPNKNEYDGLQAYLNDNQIKAKDLTIAVLCQKKKDFSSFDNVSTSKEKFAKSYGMIFDIIDGCIVSSKILNIRR